MDIPVNIVTDIIYDILDDLFPPEGIAVNANVVNIPEDITLDLVEKVFEELYFENCDKSKNMENIEENNDILNLTPNHLVEELYNTIYLENWPN
jgi:phenylalanyl-tRNA synthetase alpha subunit